MKIYTRQGDGGLTRLGNGRRVPKNHPQVQAFGVLDELNSALGWAKEWLPDGRWHQELIQIQNLLFTVGALLAHAPKALKPTPEDIAALEKWIDAYTAELPPLRRFILPGGSRAAAALHMARAICRRSERMVVELENGDLPPPEVKAYLNRLSDYLFVLARYMLFLEGKPEPTWPPEKETST